MSREYSATDAETTQPGSRAYGIPEEPRIEIRVRCPLVLSVERVMTMLVSFHLRQKDQEEVSDQVAVGSHRDDMPA